MKSEVWNGLESHGRQSPFPLLSECLWAVEEKGMQWDLEMGSDLHGSQTWCFEGKEKGFLNHASYRSSLLIIKFSAVGACTFCDSLYLK